MATAKAYVTNGDVGCGVPGSLQWHKCAVAELEGDELVEYVKEVLPAMSIEDVRLFMLHIIAEKLTDGYRS